MTMREALVTSSAPSAIGPYSQGIRSGRLVFTSGQLPMTPSGELISEDIARAARRSLQNVMAVLGEAGGTAQDVVKVTIFLSDLADFGAVNEVYGEFFAEPYPARSCVQVAKLPKDARIEIEATACIDDTLPS